MNWEELNRIGIIIESLSRRVAAVERRSASRDSSISNKSSHHDSRSEQTMSRPSEGGKGKPTASLLSTPTADQTSNALLVSTTTTPKSNAQSLSLPTLALASNIPRQNERGRRRGDRGHSDSRGRWKGWRSPFATLGPPPYVPPQYPVGWPSGWGPIPPSRHPPYSMSVPLNGQAPECSYNNMAGPSPYGWPY
jgi:hypothetical protein